MGIRIALIAIAISAVVVFVGANLPTSKWPMEGRESCKESICVKEMLIACRDGVAHWEFEISRQDRAQLGPEQQWGYVRKLTTMDGGTSEESVVHGFGPTSLPEKPKFSQGKRIIEFGMTSSSMISYELDADLVCTRKTPFLPTN